MSDFIYPKQGQVVEGVIFSVKKDVILVDLGAPTEGTIFAEYFDKPAPSDLTKVVKKGDKIRA
ncbi:MAG TPA: S1 RNA-binding domain-containing protein, partial [Acholeplasma sp.]|nr:S1 RNA-binding domain-containing protein [Acholeplasma sp.]